MTDVNSVVLIGRLTKDVKVEGFGKSTKYTLTIAVNKRVKQNNEWTDKGNFFEVVMWNIGKMADWLTKGRQIAVRGELSQDIWEKNGQKYSRVYVSGDTLDLLASPKETSDPPLKSPSSGNNSTPPKQSQQSLSVLDDMDSIPF